ncbi:MAG: energy-coupling factor ABC transporter ATP-binding protein [Lachnospiraceae bacterium]|nr:energy-coupling factor ABC transporter ATP-binding protein [Lachnospiraceae bacterium]
MPTLETKNLTHIFPDGTIAIQNISLQVKPGEFLIIAGANGSGKTVLIRHLNGLFTPTKGTVLLDGKAITANIVEARKKIGLVFQDSDSQIVGQTVAEDVAFGPENLKLPPHEIDTITKRVLEITNLTALSTQNPHVLSGGQKRKLAIAGVLAMRPEIILFDEPFTGLDYPGVISILKQIINLHKTGHTIILVTHELEKVLAHADRLAILHKGQLMEIGTPKEVILHSKHYGIRMPLKNNEEIHLMTWLE